VDESLERRPRVLPRRTGPRRGRRWWRHRKRGRSGTEVSHLPDLLRWRLWERVMVIAQLRRRRKPATAASSRDRTLYSRRGVLETGAALYENRRGGPAVALDRHAPRPLRPRPELAVNCEGSGAPAARLGLGVGRSAAPRRIARVRAAT